MSKVRLSASMSMQIQEEALFVEQWKKCLPRRRQQWLREQVYLAIESGAEVVSYTKDNYNESSDIKETVTRIQIELDLRDPKDSSAHAIYQSLSKSRRGQWLRNALILGLNVGSKGKERVAKVGGIFVSEAHEPIIQSSQLSVPTQSTPKVLPIMEETHISPAGENSGIQPKAEILVEENKEIETPAPIKSEAELVETDQVDQKPVHASQLRGLFMQG